MLIKGLDDIFARDSRKRRLREPEKAFQKRLDTEIVESRTEEYRGELTGSDKVEVKIIACAVQQLYIVGKRLPQARTDQFIKRLRIVQRTLDGVDLVLPSVKFRKS